VKLEEIRNELAHTKANVDALANGDARWVVRDFAKRG
jgi:hypothetical protein